MAVKSAFASDLDRGRKLGKYEILTRLSIGGMAELFLAFTSGPGGFRKFVALKQVLPEVRRDEQFVKMFLDEARITAAFNHGNIGQVFDLGDEGDELYLAMEFISGQNLEQISKQALRLRRPMPIGFACRVVRDACQGLHYSHAFTGPSGRPAPVIHRDVSPKNVMVTYQGDVKMIDFGIAKAKNRLGLTRVGLVKGTSGYMSPEQVRDLELDGRSDLFSVGVILHELLSGRRLFTGPNDESVMRAIAEGELATPRALNPRVPEALSQAVMKALCREREGRFSTGKEMARAIEAAAGGVMFDEDQLAAEMRSWFAKKIKATQALLELATQDTGGDLSEIAGALGDELSDPGRPSATPKGHSAHSGSATPRAREASLATPGRGKQARSPASANAETTISTFPQRPEKTRGKPQAAETGEEAAAAPERPAPRRPTRGSVEATREVPNEALRETQARRSSWGAGAWLALVALLLLLGGAVALALLPAAAPIRDRLAALIGVAPRPALEPAPQAAEPGGRPGPGDLPPSN